MRDKNNSVLPRVGQQLFQAEELLEDKDVMHSSKCNKTGLSFHRESWRSLVLFIRGGGLLWLGEVMCPECSGRLITWRNICRESGAVT